MTAFTLLIPGRVMEQARTVAGVEGIAIDRLLLSFIVEGPQHRGALRSMLERAERGDVDAALAVLDMVPDVAPEGGDGMPEPSVGRMLGR